MITYLTVVYCTYGMHFSWCMLFIFQDAFNELLELKSSALELLNVLLEETSSESLNLLRGISEDIAKDTILKVMLALWVSYNTSL